MQSAEQWTVTIIRAQGLAFLRPERSWRPIVTISVDEYEYCETVLGTDGQNPNQKALLNLGALVEVESHLDIKVWHKSQSKKKGKRRILVATASHAIGELIKRQELESKVEVRLNCQLPSRRGCATKGKPQNGAFIAFKIRPPATYSPPVLPVGADDSPSDESSNCISRDTFTDCSASDQSLSGRSGDESDSNRTDTRTKPSVRGYRIGSDDDESSSDSSHTDNRKPSLQVTTRDRIHTWMGQGGSQTQFPFEWLVASVLPSYTEKIQTAPSSESFVGRLLSSFKTYNDLRNAAVDSEYEAVFVRLQQEWTYIGCTLVALATVATGVFSMSSGPGTLFNVDRFAQNAISASGVVSALGIVCDAWFLLRYNWADLHTFQSRARDVYGSYFFFSISSRLPALSMLISSVCFLAFLGRVAYNSWPEAVIVICIIFGIMMVLQFLVFGAHWCIRRIVDGARMVSGWTLQTFAWIHARSTSPPPYDAS